MAKTVADPSAFVWPSITSRRSQKPSKPSLSYPLTKMGGMTPHDIDLRLAQIARAQHGVLSRSQALHAGATSDMINTRLQAKRLLRIDSSVYAFPSHPNTWTQRLMAATLGQDQAVVSGRAAAALHGFTGFRPGRPEITVPRGHHHESRIATVHQSDLIRRTVVDHIPVNDATITWFEIVGRVLPELAEKTLEDGLRTGLVNMNALTNQYVKLARSRRRGIGIARRLLDVRGTDYAPSASELEDLLYDAFDIPEFRPYVRQANFPWRADSPERVDGLIVIGKAITEGDGRTWHSQLTDMTNDRRRDRDALAHGYLPLRYTWVDLKFDRDGVRADARQILGVDRWAVGAA